MDGDADADFTRQPSADESVANTRSDEGTTVVEIATAATPAATAATAATTTASNNPISASALSLERFLSIRSGRIEKRKPKCRSNHIDYSISIFDLRNARQIRQDEARIAARIRLVELFAAQSRLVQYVMRKAEETLQAEKNISPKI